MSKKIIYPLLATLIEGFFAIYFFVSLMGLPWSSMYQSCSSSPDSAGAIIFRTTCNIDIVRMAVIFVIFVLLLLLNKWIFERILINKKIRK